MVMCCRAISGSAMVRRGVRPIAARDSRACVLLLEDLPDHCGGDQVAGASIEEVRAVVTESARFHSY